jgi:glycosyltransferase involved in cell wall biosynthesis
MGLGQVTVSICCIAYNHEYFISDTIEGFLKQKTSFPFEIILHDDASTDRTQEVIFGYASKFPDLIIPILQKENQFKKGIKPLQNIVFPMARGKYIALCEGDDYWTDEYKLQKQVDFLEGHEDYSLCVGGYRTLREDSGEISEINLKFSAGDKDASGFSFNLNDLKSRWMTKTLTVVFRTSAIKDANLERYRFGRDINLFYHLLKNKNRGYYLAEIFGVYRVHTGGINSMKAGLVNAEAAFNCYRELYLINQDEFTRVMYLHHSLNLVNHYLFDKSFRLSLNESLRQYLSALKLIRRFSEVRLFLTVFLPYSFKKGVKNFLTCK